MKNIGRILLIAFTVFLSVIFLLMVAVCISMAADYRGQTMGEEAYGYFTFALAITVVIGIPATILWVILVKKLKTKPPVL